MTFEESMQPKNDMHCIFCGGLDWTRRRRIKALGERVGAICQKCVAKDLHNAELSNASQDSEDVCGVCEEAPVHAAPMPKTVCGSRVRLKIKEFYG